MKLNKKNIECIAVVVFAIALTAVVMTQSMKSDVEERTEITLNEENNTTRAGVSGALIPHGEIKVEVKEAVIVGAAGAMEVVEASEEKAEEKSEWDDRALVDVKSTLNIRAKASNKAKIVGVMTRGNVATILKEKGKWIKIKSGDVKGYVKKEYCVIGDKAEKLARKLGCYKVTAKENGLRVRKEASKDAAIYKVLLKGEKLTLAKKDSTEDGWVKVLFNGKAAYVSADYVKISLVLEEAMTIDAYNKMLKEQEEAKKAKKAAASASSSRSQRSAVSADVDDVTLLAALIQSEAGNQSYEGKLAVGAVVCNRIRSSAYPNSLRAVIYQRGQFGPAHSGILAARLRSSIMDSCKRAATEALSGVDNVGGRLHFLSVRSGRRGLVIGDHVFF